MSGSWMEAAMIQGVANTSQEANPAKYPAKMAGYLPHTVGLAYLRTSLDSRW